MPLSSDIAGCDNRAVTLDTLAAYARAVLAAVAESGARLPVTAEAALPGLDLTAHMDRGALADAVTDALVPCVEGGGLAKGAARVYVAHPGLDGVPAPARWGEALFNPHAFAERLADAGLRGSYFHDLNQWQLYDPARHVGVQLMRAADGFPPWEPGAPLRPFLHWEYASRGMRLAHAGTLGVDGRGLLLAGAGGAGKSGTVVAGLLNGLDSVGDDYVLVDLAHGVRTFPLFNTLKQDPAGYQRLGLARRLGAAGAVNWQGKHQFRIADIAARPIPQSLEIAALLVPAISGGDVTTVTPIPRRDAMIALAPSGIAQMPGDRAAGFRFFSELTRMLPCYRLSLGTQPEEIAGAIASFLARGG